jgi:hypothetical protein
MATQVSKLGYVDAKLGAPTSGQQTTRTLFDTNSATAGQTYFEFFKNFAGKTLLETNLTTNKLDSMESMVIKSVFLNTENTESVYADHALLNIYVGNQNVIKDMDISFNSEPRGLAFDRIHSAVASDRRVEIRFLTDIVIPPQVNFYATLQLSNTGLDTGQKVLLEFRGYGKIFSAGMSF